MIERQQFALWDTVQAHKTITLQIWPWLEPILKAGHRMVIEIKPETRTLAQNARLWSMLTDVSRQVNWYGRKLTAEEWKHVFTSSINKQDVVPGIDGGFVVLGKSTSKMTKMEMGELQDLIEAFGAQKGVQFTTTLE
jgi:NinB protein